MNTPSIDCNQYELGSLRQELLLRIAVQNLLLIISVVLFTAFVAMAITNRQLAWLTANGACCANFVLALQWCHHGIRTAQIKQYLMLVDSNPSGWERWLPANRPQRLLGSRWMVSTKGVFLGLGAAMICLAGWLDASPSWALVVGAVVLWSSTAGFLFTNPKE